MNATPNRTRKETNPMPGRINRSLILTILPQEQAEQARFILLI